jgi:hypothetical protein
MNHFSYKYWIPLIYYSLAALAMVIAPAQLSGGIPRRLFRPALTVPALLVLATVGYGFPSWRGVRKDLDRIVLTVPLEQRTADVLGTRCTHVIGSYREVWVSVFHANLILHERGEKRIVWGITGRCLNTWDLWGRMAPEDVRVAILKEPEVPCAEAQVYQALFPPLIAVEQRPTLTVMKASQTLCSFHPSAASRAAPLELAWHSGFFCEEGEPQCPHRWCAGRGKLTIFNPSALPRNVVLDMHALTSSAQHASLYLRGELIEQTFPINERQGHICTPLRIPPGRHTLIFESDARWWFSPEIHIFSFRVINFRLLDKEVCSCR